MEHSTSENKKGQQTSGLINVAVLPYIKDFLLVLIVRKS